MGMTRLAIGGAHMHHFSQLFSWFGAMPCLSSQFPNLSSECSCSFPSVFLKGFPRSPSVPVRFQSFVTAPFCPHLYPCCLFLVPCAHFLSVLLAWPFSSLLPTGLLSCPFLPPQPPLSTCNLLNMGLLSLPSFAQQCFPHCFSSAELF